MYLHLGDDFCVSQKEIIGIFDIDTTTISKGTKNFLAKAEKEKKVITINSELPKSFIIVIKNNEEKIILSPISSVTLEKRINNILYK